MYCFFTMKEPVALYSRPLLQGLVLTVQKGETLNLNIFLLLLLLLACRKVKHEMIISEIRSHKSKVRLKPFVPRDQETVAEDHKLKNKKKSEGVELERNLIIRTL